MQEIIEIKRYKRGIYQVITRADAFLVSENLLAEKHLYKGATIADELINELKAEGAAEICYQKALELMARRDHFCAELKLKLLLRKYTSEQIDYAIRRLVDEKIINELYFAERLVAEKQEEQSKLKIKKYLLNKGCPQDITEQVLVNLELDEKMKAYNALVKKFGKTGEFDYQKQRVKILRYLAGQGYGYSDANAAYQEFVNRKKDND